MDYLNFLDLSNWLSLQATPLQGATVNAQEHWDQQGVDSEASYEHYKPSQSGLADTVDTLPDFSYETAPASYECGSDGSSVSSSASSTSVDSFDLCEEFNADSDSLTPPTGISSPTFEIEPYDYDFPRTLDSTDASGFYPDVDPDFFVSPGDINSPLSNTNPCDFASSSTAESADTSSIIAPRPLDTTLDTTPEGPRYLNCLARPYDNAVNDPSNASLPHISGTTSTTYGSLLGGSLGNFLYGEEELAVDSTQEGQGPNSRAGRDASAVTIVPAEINNIDNINLEQTVNEQSDWAVNSLYEEGIAAFTSKFDHDTGAGPSTGSSVAAAMLDIGHAPHSRRDEGAAVISAAPEEPKGKEKRKAMDAPELPPPSKKSRLAVEPSAQIMDNFICSWPTPEFSTDPEGLNQSDVKGFIQVSPETASGGEQLLSLSGEESAYTTFVQAKDGGLKARSMVSARDSHARRRARKGNQ